MSAATKRNGAPGAGDAGPRPAIWAALRTRGALTAREAADAGRCDAASARAYLRALVAAGIATEELKASCGPRGTIALWRHVPEADPGAEAPRLRTDGTPAPVGTGRQAMWTAMRILKDFGARELAATTGADEVDAQYYCKHLARAGYLVISVKGKGIGAGGIPTRYRFVPPRHPAPLAPQITRVRAVHDPNLGRIVYPVTAEDPA